MKLGIPIRQPKSLGSILHCILINCNNVLSECGIDYSPPSQHVLAVLDPPKVSPTEDKPSSLRTLESDEASLSNSIMQYEKEQVGWT